jgi:hypothetical protein
MARRDVGRRSSESTGARGAARFCGRRGATAVAVEQGRGVASPRPIRVRQHRTQLAPRVVAVDPRLLHGGRASRPCNRGAGRDGGAHHVSEGCGYSGPSEGLPTLGHSRRSSRDSTGAAVDDSRFLGRTDRADDSLLLEGPLPIRMTGAGGMWLCYF